MEPHLALLRSIAEELELPLEKVIKVVGHVTRSQNQEPSHSSPTHNITSTDSESSEETDPTRMFRRKTGQARLPRPPPMPVILEDTPPSESDTSQTPFPVQHPLPTSVSDGPCEGSEGEAPPTVTRVPTASLFHHSTADMALPFVRKSSSIPKELTRLRSARMLARSPSGRLFLQLLSQAAIDGEWVGGANGKRILAAAKREKRETKRASQRATRFVLARPLTMLVVTLIATLFFMIQIPTPSFQLGGDMTSAIDAMYATFVAFTFSSTTSSMALALGSLAGQSSRSGRFLRIFPLLMSFLAIGTSYFGASVFTEVDDTTDIMGMLTMLLTFLFTPVIASLKLGGLRVDLEDTSSQFNERVLDSPPLSEVLLAGGFIASLTVAMLKGQSKRFWTTYADPTDLQQITSRSYLDLATLCSLCSIALNYFKTSNNNHLVAILTASASNYLQVATVTKFVCLTTTALTPPSVNFANTGFRDIGYPSRLTLLFRRAEEGAWIPFRITEFSTSTADYPLSITLWGILTIFGMDVLMDLFGAAITRSAVPYLKAGFFQTFMDLCISTVWCLFFVSAPLAHLPIIIPVYILRCLLHASSALPSFVGRVRRRRIQRKRSQGGGDRLRSEEFRRKVLRFSKDGDHAGRLLQRCRQLSRAALSRVGVQGSGRGLELVANCLSRRMVVNLDSELIRIAKACESFPKLQELQHAASWIATDLSWREVRYLLKGQSVAPQRRVIEQPLPPGHGRLRLPTGLCWSSPLLLSEQLDLPMTYPIPDPPRVSPPLPAPLPAFTHWRDNDPEQTQVIREVAEHPPTVAFVPSAMIGDGKTISVEDFVRIYYLGKVGGQADTLAAFDPIPISAACELSTNTTAFMSIEPRRELPPTNAIAFAFGCDEVTFDLPLKMANAVSNVEWSPVFITRLYQWMVAQVMAVFFVMMSLPVLVSPAILVLKCLVLVVLLMISMDIVLRTFIKRFGVLQGVCKHFFSFYFEQEVPVTFQGLLSTLMHGDTGLRSFLHTNFQIIAWVAFFSHHLLDT
eukprot:gnl/Dysnectes_brevis/3712_a4755_389.p1 GENE.gnl/Dysnectes_brevis/3712_a4755_389~~gnl/Dysnectes_brevis/3712_a4755_389.p1  ORF type:complete len:1027 (-),score=444.59 gnl/Dysnectes_brevis/3712_a4755_389:992-4072(-)